jgi:hypothetical protein
MVLEPAEVKVSFGSRKTLAMLENKARGSQSQERDVFHAPRKAQGRAVRRRVARRRRPQADCKASRTGRGVIRERVQATAVVSLERVERGRLGRRRQWPSRNLRPCGVGNAVRHSKFVGLAA